MIYSKSNITRKRFSNLLTTKLKTIKNSSFGFSFLFFLGITTVNAQQPKTGTNKVLQEENMDDNYKAFETHLHLKNMHIWHGFVVQPGAMFAGKLEYNTKNKKITVGVWGGSSFSNGEVGFDAAGNNVTGSYKELSIYAVYRFTDKFFFEAVTHNNYTGVAERGEKLNYFGYDRRQTYNFVDLNFGYQITPSFSLYAGTILFGQSSDFEVQSDGSIENNWTNYVEAKAKLWEKNDYKLNAVVGGAFSLVTEKTFYTERQANIINVALSLSKNVTLGSYTLPVEATAMWNPEKKVAVLQLDLLLF